MKVCLFKVALFALILPSCARSVSVELYNDRGERRVEQTLFVTINDGNGWRFLERQPNGRFEEKQGLFKSAKKQPNAELTVWEWLVNNLTVIKFFPVSTSDKENEIRVIIKDSDLINPIPKRR